jgi:predicted GNAT family N-acyltransferase
VAWAVVRPDGEITSIAFRIKDAWSHATGNDRVVPLYRQPTLTDEEREVLGRVADDAWYRAMDHTEQVVRKLLERAGRIKKPTEIGGLRV